MTYATGQPIAALDYNTFATLAGGMNEIYADLHLGATTLPNAGLGYGQTPLVAVVASNPILASEWTALFQTMRKSGTHQGTTIVPPLPVANPVATNTIFAYNTPTTLSALIGTLTTNRFNKSGETFGLVSSAFAQPGATPWTNSLTFSYSVDFGSWNNARYFFNSGGFVTLAGNYAPIVTPEDTQWQATFTTMNPLVFNYNATTPFSGIGGTAIGFYNLTTIYQTVYLKAYGAGPYTASYIQVQAKLAAAAGTNGLVDFTVLLSDQEVGIKEVKNGTTTYTVAQHYSSTEIVYPAPGALARTNLGFIST